MRTGLWKQRLAKFRALSGADKRLLLHAAARLALARLMLLVFPFRRLAERLSAKDEEATSNPDPELLQRIGNAVRAAANNVPWRSDCFPQSIAGWMLLKHYGFKSTIRIGVEKKGKDELAGHAWLTCGDTVITGGDDLARYTEMLPL
jgi:hypothetical protein